MYEVEGCKVLRAGGMQRGRVRVTSAKNRPDCRELPPGPSIIGDDVGAETYHL